MIASACCRLVYARTRRKGCVHHSFAVSPYGDASLRKSYWVQVEIGAAVRNVAAGGAKVVEHAAAEETDVVVMKSRWVPSWCLCPTAFAPEDQVWEELQQEWTALAPQRIHGAAV